VSDERISEARVPFGVLTVNGAMREILAWCCWQRWHFEAHSTPVAVFVYEHNGVACGVCLALRTIANVASMSSWRTLRVPCRRSQRRRTERDNLEHCLSAANYRCDVSTSGGMPSRRRNCSARCTCTAAFVGF